MKLTNRGQRKRLAKLAEVGLAVCLALMGPVLRVYAEFGPCNTTTVGYTLDTISCLSGGGCTGLVQTVPNQKSCGNASEDGCNNLANDRYVTYSPKAVDQGFATYSYCCGISWSCSVCAASLGFICAYTSGTAWQTCVIGAGCGVCALATGCDYCCYTTCEQDLTTRFPVPGGSNC